MDLSAMFESTLSDDTKIIGSGGWGEIRLGILDGKETAIKSECAEMAASGYGIHREAKLYPYVKGELGFPQVIAEDIKESGSLLALERLGMSLSHLVFELCDGRFSLKTILMIADQLLTRLEVLHDKGIIHNDLQPHNILIGHRHEAEGVLHLIDFGISEQITPDSHIKCNDFLGTMSLSSTRKHCIGTENRGSELMSLYYLLYYLLRHQQLAWAPLEDEVKYEDTDDGGRIWYPRIFEMKQEHNRGCEDDIELAIPEAFVQFRKYAMECSETDGDRPDYSYLRRLFRELFFCKGYSMDGEFDWSPILRELDENNDPQYRKFQEGRKAAETRREAAAAATTKEDDEGRHDSCVGVWSARSGSRVTAGKNAARMTEKQKRLYEETFGVVTVFGHHDAFPRDLSMCDVERIRELQEAVHENRVPAEIMKDVETEIQELSKNLEQRRLRRISRENQAYKRIREGITVGDDVPKEELVSRFVRAKCEVEHEFRAMSESDPEYLERGMELGTLVGVIWRLSLLDL